MQGHSVEWPFLFAYDIMWPELHFCKICKLLSCSSSPSAVVVANFATTAPQKLRNYLPGFVQSLLAKHNSLSNSHRQRYNSGSNRQPTHPHKPAAMYARRLNIPHNHGKSTICCSTRPKTYGPPAVLGYLMLHGFNCAHGSSKSQSAGSISIRP